MLTIKQMTDTGEALFQGEEITFIKGDNDVACQVMYLDGKEWKSIGSGVVYVMNDAGKTIGTYYLPAPLNTAGIAA